jgi:glutamate synthase (NADPH/NADH) large chain
LAGERFAVRNSGAHAVIEGAGANACEYMTGGTVVILGPVGENFGAGMSGGMAFVYDEDGRFPDMANPDSIVWARIQSPYWEGLLRQHIEEHGNRTSSAPAALMLGNWDGMIGRFWQVCPREMLGRLEHPLSAPRSSVAAA